MDTTNSQRLQSLVNDILLQQMQQQQQHDDDLQQDPMQQQQQQQQQQQLLHNFQIIIDKPNEQIINNQLPSQLEDVNSQQQQQQQQMPLQPLFIANGLNQQQQQQPQLNRQHKKCKNCGRVFLQQQNQQQSQQTQQQRHRHHCPHRNDLSVIGYPVERVNNINRVINNNNNNNTIMNANANNNNNNDINLNANNNANTTTNLSNIKTRFHQILLHRHHELQQTQLPPIIHSLPLPQQQVQQQQQQQPPAPPTSVTPQPPQQQQQSSSIAVADIITSPPPFPPQTLLATAPPLPPPQIPTIAVTRPSSPANSPKVFTTVHVKSVVTKTLNGFEHDNNIFKPTLLAERYLLLDLVDGGSMYKCYDVTSHDELVCKIAKNPCSNLLSAHFRLDGHPHINPFHKIIQGTFQTYLFFLPSHGDLHSYVRVRKRLKEMEAKRLFRQMCKTVKACHEHGIVLRDLKLRKFVFSDKDKTNLRLESLEDAVVLDNPAEDLLQDKRGCPAYVSPEILKANTTYSGKAADMWSLGVILYTMLVGRYPFNDSEHASLFAKISRGHFLVPDCLSSKARCMIRALLRRDPEERITSEDVLYHPWLTRDEQRDNSRSTHDQCVPTLYFEDDDDSFKSN